MISFDELMTNTLTFPTAALIKIQVRNHSASALTGFAHGLWIGPLTGFLLGTFVGGDSPEASPEQQQSAYGTVTRGDIMLDGLMAECILGLIFGAAAGAIIGTWEDI